MFLDGNSFFSYSRTQKSIAFSSADAEYLSLIGARSEALSIHSAIRFLTAAPVTLKALIPSPNNKPPHPPNNEYSQYIRVYHIGGVFIIRGWGGLLLGGGDYEVGGSGGIPLQALKSGGHDFGCDFCVTLNPKAHEATTKLGSPSTPFVSG